MRKEQRKKGDFTSEEFFHPFSPDFLRCRLPSVGASKWEVHKQRGPLSHPLQMVGRTTTTVSRAAATTTSGMPSRTTVSCSRERVGLQPNCRHVHPPELSHTSRLSDAVLSLLSSVGKTAIVSALLDGRPCDPSKLVPTIGICRVYRQGLTVCCRPHLMPRPTHTSFSFPFLLWAAWARASPLSLSLWYGHHLHRSTTSRVRSATTCWPLRSSAVSLRCCLSPTPRTWSRSPFSSASTTWRRPV